MEGFKKQPVNNQEQLKNELTGEDVVNEKNKIPKLIENAKRELQHQLDLAKSKYENDLKHYPETQHTTQSTYRFN